MAIKTFLVGLYLAVHTLCHYYTKYQPAILSGVDASDLTLQQKSDVKVFLATTVALCDVFHTLSEFIPGS